jgi:phage baseplate assembly protein gpV
MMDNTANLTTLIFQIRPDIVMEGFDDGALLLRLSDRHLIEVNPVGQHILELTDGQRSAQQIAGLLAQKFDISAEEAMQDTLTFYDGLLTQAVLEKVPHTINNMEIPAMSDATNIASRFLRNPDVVLREEDEDGALLFNPDTNQVKVINPTGLFIWQHCDGQNGLGGIVKSLMEAFEDAPANQVSQDVQEFLEGMLQSGFVGTIE